MPVVLHQLIPANAGQPGYLIAKELALQSTAQFGSVRGASAGIGDGSCCAALAVNIGFWGTARSYVGVRPLGGGYVEPLYGAPLAYGIVFGNSMIARSRLDFGPLGGHGERCALTAAGGTPLFDIGGNNAVLFVELSPCHGCDVWLNGGGGGVANPYNGLINGAGPFTLNVWYRWPYPAGVGAMEAFHLQSLQNQLAQINGPTW